MHASAILPLLLSLAGAGYTLHAAYAVSRMNRLPVPHGPAEPVSLLKPLHGAEPRLAENLATFLDQDWDAPIEMVAGVQRVDDPALEALANLSSPAKAGAHGSGGKWAPTFAGEDDVRIIVDPTPHGANAKVSNLINMLPAARHDLIVLSDSDMAVPRDYLAVLSGALAAPGVGAVTCVYRGRGDAGRWSDLAAAGISYHFLPQLVLGLALGLARPGMGSTIALRRTTLDAIGGFGRFADHLADDYALGEAVRDLGLTVAVPPMLLVHGCPETSLAALWRHELRWAVTIRRINLPGYAGMVVTHPLPFALLALPLAPVPASVALLAAIGARLALKRAVDRFAGTPTAPAWMLAPRDCLSFAVFLASFVARSVDWRGSRFNMERAGRMSAAPESFPR